MPLTAAVSEAMSASMARSPRASITAMPWSPMVPESSTPVAGPHPAAELPALGDEADARGGDEQAVGGALGHHLRVAGDDLHARGLGRVAPCRRRSPAAPRSGSPPPARTPRRASAARAPAIARSFTVPCTARWPIEPPGKRRGCTTNESVENASRSPPGSGEHGAVAELLQLVAERLDEHRVHERGRGLAARPVRERDDLVLEPRPAAAERLDPADDLAPRRRRARRHECSSAGGSRP